MSTTTMNEVEAHHRGVNVRVTLAEPIVVTQAWTGDRVSVEVLHDTYYEVPKTGDDVGHMYGDGHGIKKDGTVGRQWRNRVTVPPEVIPAGVRDLIAHAVQEEWGTVK